MPKITGFPLLQAAALRLRELLDETSEAMAQADERKRLSRTPGERRMPRFYWALVPRDG